MSKNEEIIIEKKKAFLKNVENFPIFLKMAPHDNWKILIEKISKIKNNTNKFEKFLSIFNFG